MAQRRQYSYQQLIDLRNSPYVQSPRINPRRVVEDWLSNYPRHVRYLQRQRVQARSQSSPLAKMTPSESNNEPSTGASDAQATLAKQSYRASLAGLREKLALLPKDENFSKDWTKEPPVVKDPYISPTMKQEMFQAEDAPADAEGPAQISSQTVQQFDPPSPSVSRPESSVTPTPAAPAPEESPIKHEEQVAGSGGRRSGLVCELLPLEFRHEMGRWPLTDKEIVEFSLAYMIHHKNEEEDEATAASDERTTTSDEISRGRTRTRHFA